MVDSRQRLAAHARTGRVDLDHLLRARDRDEIARLMWRLRRWHRELLPLVEAHDPAMVPYLEILRPKPEELQRIWRWLGDLPSGYQRGLCNAVEASLVRINDHLMRQPGAMPRGKGGNRRQFDDGPIVEKARAIYAADGSVNKAAAVRNAKRRHPKLFHLRGMGPDNVESAIKRISRKI